MIEHFNPIILIKQDDVSNDMPGRPLFPGDTVIHLRDVHSYGIVISVVDADVTVLWSKEPDRGYLYAPYTPLQVTPVVFDYTDRVKPQQNKISNKLLYKYASLFKDAITKRDTQK